MTILCYHEVRPDWSSPLAVEPGAFQDHMRWVQRSRTVLPLPHALGRLDASGRLPRGLTALTFDDGFTGLYDHAFPLLARRRLPATVFLVAETLTERGRPVDWVDTPPPYPLTTLTRDQVLEMQDAGVAFESHSYAHHDLTRLSHGECVQDLRESRELLEDLLRRPVTLLAYPRGRHSAHVRDAAARAGYTSAFALPETAEERGPYAVPRVGIYRGNATRTVRVKSTRSYLPVRNGPAYALARRLASRARPAGARAA